MSIQSLDRSSSVKRSRTPLSSDQWRWPVAGSRRSRITPSARTRRTGLLDDVAEDLGRVAQHGDPGGDLAQRLLRLGAAAERLARFAELGDQPCRGDRDRGLVGDGDEELRVRLAPRVLAPGDDGEGPERTPFADQRCGHHRMPTGAAHERVPDLAMRERAVGEVVARPDRPGAEDGLPGDPLVDRLVRVVRRDDVAGPLVARDVGAGELVRRRVDEVDARAVGVEQADRLVDRALEHGRQVGRRADPRGDLAQRALDVGARAASSAREWSSSLDEPGIRHRGGGMVGQRPDEGDVRRR